VVHAAGMEDGAAPCGDRHSPWREDAIQALECSHSEPRPRVSQALLVVGVAFGYLSKRTPDHVADLIQHRQSLRRVPRLLRRG
jgi:hypothetical protein